MFAQFRHDHHGDGRTIVAVKTGEAEEARTLIEAAPEYYSRVAYFRAEWVGLALAATLTGTMSAIASRAAGN